MMFELPYVWVTDKSKTSKILFLLFLENHIRLNFYLAIEAYKTINVLFTHTYV